MKRFCVRSAVAPILLFSCFAGRLGGAPADGPAGVTGLIDVDDFGARGDGVHDDAPALQAALDAVAKSGHGRLHFRPYGVYRTGAAVHLKGGGEFEIDGQGATIQPMNALTIRSITGAGDTLLLQHCSNFTIRRLKFEGNGTARGARETAVSLRMFDCADFRIIECTFRDAVCDHLYFAAADSRDDATACRDGVVRDCTFDGAWRNGISVIHAHRLTFRNNTIRNVNGTRPQAGIDIEANTSGSNADSDGANYDITIAENSFSGCIGSAVQIPGVKSPTRISIVGNTMTGSGVGVPDDAGASEIAVCDNVIHDIKGVGIAMGGMRGVVRGNRVMNGTDYAIYATGGQHLISGNTVTDFGVAANGRCISISNHTTAGSVIEGNLVRKTVADPKWIPLVRNNNDFSANNYQFGCGDRDGPVR